MASVLGRIDWGVSRDEEGHREYGITWLVKSTTAEGPGAILNASGSCATGSSWTFGGDNDVWAFCRPTAQVSPVIKPEKGLYWTLEQTFSTKPAKRCQDQSIENPLNEPDRLSGSFVKYQKEIQEDRFGLPITSSSWEQIRGAIVTFDSNKPTVQIGKNLLILPLAQTSQMTDTVNSAGLWGLGPRMIKLSNMSWQRLIYGRCNYYYTVTYEFDIDFSTFDRVGKDEGLKCLIGWSPAHKDLENPPAKVDPFGVEDGAGIENRFRPDKFEQYKDGNGENTRVMLDGNGRPALDGREPADIDISSYSESNFLTLGIPTSF